MLCHDGTFVVVMDVPCSAWPLKAHLYSVCCVKFIKHLIYGLIFYVSTVCSLLLVFWFLCARLQRDISMYSLLHTLRQTHPHTPTDTHMHAHTHTHCLSLSVKTQFVWRFCARSLLMNTFHITNQKMVIPPNDLNASLG